MIIHVRGHAIIGWLGWVEDLKINDLWCYSNRVEVRAKIKNKNTRIQITD